VSDCSEHHVETDLSSTDFSLWIFGADAQASMWRSIAPTEIGLTKSRRKSTD